MVISLFSKYINRPLSILLSIYMVNLSMDAADIGGNFDPTINEIESVVEFVTEVMLEKGNVFPEQDEPDPESEICPVSLDHIITSTLLINLERNAFYLVTRRNFLFAIHYKNPFLSFQSPPPKGKLFSL